MRIEGWRVYVEVDGFQPGEASLSSWWLAEGCCVYSQVEAEDPGGIRAILGSWAESGVGITLDEQDYNFNPCHVDLWTNPKADSQLIWRVGRISIKKGIGPVVNGGRRSIGIPCDPLVKVDGRHLGTIAPEVEVCWVCVDVRFSSWGDGRLAQNYQFEGGGRLGNYDYGEGQGYDAGLGWLWCYVYCPSSCAYAGYLCLKTERSPDSCLEVVESEGGSMDAWEGGSPSEVEIVASCHSTIGWSIGWPQVCAIYLAQNVPR